MDRKKIKETATKLRQQGKTYAEIQQHLKIRVPKATLFHWFHNISLNQNARKRINDKQKNSLKKAQQNSILARQLKRNHYLDNLFQKNRHLADLLDNKEIAQMALSILYLGEGSKNPKRGSIVFGNSDPKVIKLFLKLLKLCYAIDNKKFRCTIQCRADQNIPKLQRFWSSVTKIPLHQFYNARIDARTIGKISRNPDYKGVCRIDYFSANILNELLKVIEIITCP